MAMLVTKIEFPRNSPDGLITMGEGLLEKHDEDPKLVAFTPEERERLSSSLNAAKAKRSEAKKLVARSVELNGEADKILGLALGQSLEDETTSAGLIAKFRDEGSRAFKGNIEKLRNYGFTVTITQKAARVTKKMIEKATILEAKLAEAAQKAQEAKEAKAAKKAK